MERKTLAIAIACALLLSLLVTLIALGQQIQWSKQFGFEGESVTESFAVYTDDTYTTLWNQGPEDLGSYLIGSQIVKTFYIENDGNTAITVEVTNEVNSNAANTVAWNPTTLSLAAGEQGSMTLTVTVNAEGAATYSFDFTIQ